MGDFPLMTDKGTFIINGAERVIVTQWFAPRPITLLKSTRQERNYFLPQLFRIAVLG